MATSWRMRPGLVMEGPKVSRVPSHQWSKNGACGAGGASVHWPEHPPPGGINENLCSEEYQIDVKI